MNRTMIASAVALATAASIATAAALSGGQAHHTTPTTAGAQDHSHHAPARIRTLVVHPRGHAARSESPQAMKATRVRGSVPRTATIATVRTDEDCAPDAAGVSHCLNRLELPGGRKLVVRHLHRMADVPCMTPGERVRVMGS